MDLPFYSISNCPEYKAKLKVQSINIITVNLIDSPIVLDTREVIFTYHPLIDSMSYFRSFAVELILLPLVFYGVCGYFHTGVEYLESQYLLQLAFPQVYFLSTFLRLGISCHVTFQLYLGLIPALVCFGLLLLDVYGYDTFFFLNNSVFVFLSQ